MQLRPHPTGHLRLVDLQPAGRLQESAKVVKKSSQGYSGPWRIGPGSSQTSSHWCSPPPPLFAGYHRLIPRWSARSGICCKLGKCLLHFGVARTEEMDTWFPSLPRCVRAAPTLADGCLFRLLRGIAGIQIAMPSLLIYSEGFPLLSELPRRVPQDGIPVLMACVSVPLIHSHLRRLISIMGVAVGEKLKRPRVDDEWKGIQCWRKFCTRLFRAECEDHP